MTIKYFNDRTIAIEYDKDSVTIHDCYNNFVFKMDSSMKKYFVPCMEILYKICKLHKSEHIPTHGYPDGETNTKILCSEILNCCRGRYRFSGNYMDINRKNKIISAFKECFKRVKEEDIELSDIDLKRLDLKSLLLVKKGLL